MAVPARARPRAVQLGEQQGLTIETAIDHLVDAAQGVVQNQLELARLDLALTATRLLRGTALVLVGALLLGGAAGALAMASYAVFPDWYPPEQRLAIIAGVCAVLGTGIAVLGVRRMRSHGGA